MQPKNPNIPGHARERKQALLCYRRLTNGLILVYKDKASEHPLKQLSGSIDEPTQVWVRAWAWCYLAQNLDGPTTVGELLALNNDPQAQQLILIEADMSQERFHHYFTRCYLTTRLPVTGIPELFDTCVKADAAKVEQELTLIRDKTTEEA